MIRALTASALALLLAFAPNAVAGTALTETEVFIRCYSQLTQLSLAPNDPLLTAVATGTKTAANACLETFDRARFGTNGRIANATDRVSLAVLSNLHHLHASWFGVRDYVILRDLAGLSGLKDYYDIDTPAFYFTRAAFAPNVQFKTIVTSTKNLRAVRSDNDPALGVGSRRSKAQSVFGKNWPTCVLLAMVTHPSGPVHFGLRTPFKGCEAQMPTITMLVQSGGKSVYPARKLFSFFRFANDLSVALQKLQEDYLSSDWSSLLQTA